LPPSPFFYYSLAKLKIMLGGIHGTPAAFYNGRRNAMWCGLSRAYLEKSKKQSSRIAPGRFAPTTNPPDPQTRSTTLEEIGAQRGRIEATYSPLQAKRCPARAIMHIERKRPAGS